MLKKIRHRSSKELVEFLTEKIENRGVPPLIFDSVMKIIFFGDHPKALPEKDSEGGKMNKFRVSDKLIPWFEEIIVSGNSSVEEEIKEIIEKIKNNLN